MDINFTQSKLIVLIVVSLTLIVSLVLIYFKLNPTSSIVKNSNCHQTGLPYQDSTLPTEERVADLMNRMTDAEKIGQMVLIEKNSIRYNSHITKYNIGALLSGGGAGPKEDTSLAWLEMMNNFQAAAKDTRLEIPLLYGIDAVHGHGNVLGATIFPHAIGLGATRDADLVKRVAAATAEEMAATGIYWNYAPNLDVANDIRWGKTFKLLAQTPIMWHNWDRRI